MKKTVYRIALLALIIIWGCTPIISKNVMDQVDQTVSFTATLENPSSYQEKMVLWGGEIISTRNQKDGTLIEILQKSLQYGNRPDQGDDTGGRFLALYDGYLDSAVYAKGRQITVAGVIRGSRVRKLDEIDYTYPLLAVEEIHLWTEITEEDHDHFFHHHPFHWGCCPYPYYYHW
ncbi:MAG: Slp family lipoprotein [Deltaproteobacteria bacterium]|nr:Slp family lipoprotein [Deltaproteobacteria bacterium]